MLVLITYDVNTMISAGKRRHRMVAKKCVAHGTRVQNSVFECVLDNSQYKLLKHELEQLIDTNCDSLTPGNIYWRRERPSHPTRGGWIEMHLNTKT